MNKEELTYALEVQKGFIEYARRQRNVLLNEIREAKIKIKRIKMKIKELRVVNHE